MATVSQTTPYLCTSLLFLEDQAIKRAINTRDGYIKRYYHARGEHVRKIQRCVALMYEIEHGESQKTACDRLVDDHQKVKTGIYGDNTHYGVSMYQLKFGLIPDGICGPITLKHMDSYWADKRPLHTGIDPWTLEVY